MTPEAANFAPDELDIALIAELEVDAGQTVSSLAEKLGSERRLIKRKLQKLLDNRIIKIIALADPFALGFKTIAWIGINTRPKGVNSVAESLCRFTDVHHISINAGRYDIHALAVFKKPEEISDFIREKLTTIKNLTSAETMLVLDIRKGSFGLFSSDATPLNYKRSSKHLDTLDLKIINELRENPRQNHIEMAPKLNSSPPTICRRKKMLLDEKIINIIGIPNPNCFGFTTRATIAINAQPSAIDLISDKLSTYKFIHGVMINTGRFDIVAWGDFKGNKDLSHFVTKEMAALNGLIKHETMITLKIIKDEYLFELN